MKPVVISAPDQVRVLRRLSDSGRVPVVFDARVLGGAGRSESSAKQVAEEALGGAGLRLIATDAACLWIGDHPPRAARAVKVPGDKRPYVAVSIWLVTTGA